MSTAFQPSMDASGLREPDRLCRQGVAGGKAQPPRFAGRPGRRLGWRSGLVALSLLGGMGLACAMTTSLAAIEPRDGAPPPAGIGLALDIARPLPAEPATFGGMGRALAGLRQDIGAWQRLLGPDLDSGSPGLGLDVGLGAARAAVAAAAEGGRVVRAAAAQQEDGATTHSRAPHSQAPHSQASRSPDRLALTALAVTFATVTLLAGLAALLLERLLLAPFRALRAAAKAISDGEFDIAVPGTERHDEAGALARTLEGFRITALARQAADHESLGGACLVGAPTLIEASARRIERVAADASALALECCLVVQGHAAADAGCEAVAQGVRALSIRVVALREAGLGAAAAVREIVEAVGALDAVANAAKGSGSLPDRRPERARSMAEAC